MPILNPKKCYTQQPKRLTITVPTNLPNDWLSSFYVLLSVQLKLNDETKQEVFDHQKKTMLLLTEKEKFFKELNEHVGEQSTYSLKPQLLESLSTLYCLFTHPKTTREQKYLIASGIAEDVGQCSPGFTNRVNYIISRFNMPQNMDELIAQVRFNLVDRIAGIIAAKNPQGIHVHNRVIDVAEKADFGVWSINKDDVYSRTGSRDLSDAKIIDQLNAGFANHFHLFALVNALRDVLEASIAPHGYQGKGDLEHGYKIEEYEKFCECLNLFITIPMNDLLKIDTMSKEITNIHWQQVTSALLQKLRKESYVTLSHEETALLNSFLKYGSALYLTILDTPILDTLIPHGYELVQFLEFASQWNIEHKAALVFAYLDNKYRHKQKEVLAILHNEAPQLTAQLKKEPNLQAIYFDIAIAEEDGTAVRTYVEEGANINKALPLLFSKAHKSDTLYWLHEHPHLLQKMTVTGMNTVIKQGKYQEKTIADTLVSTKKGRQLLLENGPLQTLLSHTAMTNRLSDCLKQAQMEHNTMNTQVGFFKKSSPLTLQLVQTIVYGDLTKSEELLKANPSLLETLLTEKATVIDYLRRKVRQKTAFQAALCAMDDELCAMLARYMTKEEIARQYQEIFPEGHETYYQKQTPFDFSQIVEAISQGSDDDVNKALNLGLRNSTKLWGQLDQFRADFTKRSSQEAVFNPQHLIKALELFNSQFHKWSCEQQNLCWRQVIGYVQRFMPANIAMDFAQGLYDRVEMKEKSVRSFKFRHGYGITTYPLVFNSFSGLGYEYAVTSGSSYPRASYMKYEPELISKFMSSKNGGLARIIQPEVAWNLCIIM